MCKRKRSEFYFSANIVSLEGTWAMFTVYQIAFAPPRTSYRIGLPFTHTKTVVAARFLRRSETRQWASEWNKSLAQKDKPLVQK